MPITNKIILFATRPNLIVTLRRSIATSRNATIVCHELRYDPPCQGNSIDANEENTHPEFF